MKMTWFLLLSAVLCFALSHMVQPKTSGAISVNNTECVYAQTC